MAKPTPQTPTLKIRVTGPEQGRYRGGFGTVRKFTPEVQEFTDLDLTEDELAELGADPELKVEIAHVIAMTAPVDPAPAPAPEAPAA